MRTQQWMHRGLVLAGLVLGLAGPAQAILMDRGSFDYTDSMGSMGMVNLIYDQDLGITWLGDANLAQSSGFDANGLMTWQESVDWSEGLTVGGVSGWRLPTTTQPDPSCSSQFDSGLNGLIGSGFGCTGSEMGHLFNVEGITALAPGVFSNVQAADTYWSGTESLPTPNFAWRFNFINGNQTLRPKQAPMFAWAVHSGDVASPPQVPEPSTMLLMGSGLIGLLGWRFRRG